jgi:CubicO group peptidase (beta-lactamase class C family)
MRSSPARSRNALVCAYFAALTTFAVGCLDDAPANNTNDTGDGIDDSDDNPDIDDIEPHDPLGGALSSDCDAFPETPWAAWSSPSSLGNGLVHDSRLNLNTTTFTKEIPAADLFAGTPWSSFVSVNQRMMRSGFRPAQVRAEISLQPAGSGHVSLEVVDRSVYISDDDANYRTEIETYVFAGRGAEQTVLELAPQQWAARPTSIDSFTLADGRFGYTLAWVYEGDNTLPWKLRAGMTSAAMLAQIVELQAEKYRPVSVSSRVRDDQLEYAAIFVQDGMSADDWSVTLNSNAGELAQTLSSASKLGLYPFRVSAVSRPSSRVDILWARRPPGSSIQIRLNLTQTTFEREDALRRTQGYHLETLESYRDAAGAERLIAVWIQYAPCLRWTGTDFITGDLAYETRYEMFHDQAIAATLAGTEYEGRALRPSGTLHIFEGSDLVLNRAYTYAPAIYPETPLDTPMRLGSVSKSITAAAVVKVMHDKGLDLTMPFTLAAWMVGAPETMKSVTVLDVLRNQGGFRAEHRILTSMAGPPDSYLNHTIIDESPYGAFPIDSEEMVNYAILGGHLDTSDTGSYWDFVRYEDSQSNGVMHYSNVGFSMLSELVRQQAHMLYEQYVIDSFAVKLNIKGMLFSDPGHRKDARGPTLAGLRTYLSAADHPYRYVPPGQNAPDQLPLFGAEALPTHSSGLRGGSAMAWRVNAGPLDPAAPQFASVGRYSGQYHVGGAVLAAGGWNADGMSLGVLIRVLSQGDFLMPNSVVKQLWSAQWKNSKNPRAQGWSYGLGWYIRGNWIAWAGAAEGGMGTALHNLAYDFTVVHLSNAFGNGLEDFVRPLMESPQHTWGGSKIGAIFPCLDDVDTLEDECETVTADTPY